jgi:probable F420-dependent oxidoreductase
MRFGIMLPTVGRVAAPDAVRSIAQHAESVGADSLWASDHLTMPVDQRTSLPHEGGATYPVPVDRNYLEAFTTLTWIAPQTTRAALGTAVCIAPYRSPVLMAKVLGTLSVLSGRRFNLGIGSGWLREEYAALGLDFARRHRDTDDLIRMLRTAASSDGVVDLPGEEPGSVEGMYVRPYPPADMPVWVGGSGPLARRRTGRLGDVWFPNIHGCSPSQASAGFEEIRSIAEAEGRGTDAVRMAVFMEIQLGDEVHEAPWLVGQQVRGPASYALDLIWQYREAGMTEVILAFGGGGAIRRQHGLDTLLAAGLDLELSPATVS